jgi:vesicular inhibitory amino acid transporter
MSGLTRGILKLTIRIVLPLLIVIVAIFIPSFDKIMSLLGSLAGFTICIILPCLFHLTLFKGQLSVKQRVLDWTLVVVATIIACFGTVFAFLPKSLLGIRE